MPTLNGLRCLVTVARTGSVTAAAAELHLSQPALSHQLAALERELGTVLFERLPRGVRPTAAAREMLGDANVALRAAERAEQKARAVAAGTAGHLRIGIAESMTTPVLVPVLSEWLTLHPNVRITLDERSSADELSRALADGELDITISPHPGNADGHQVTLGDEEILAAVPAHHPFARRARDPSLSEVAREPIVHYSPSNGLRAWLDAHAASCGVTFRAAVETRQAASAALLAAAGLGVALVPATAVPPSFPGRLRHLRPRLVRPIIATHLDDHDALLAHLRAALERHGVPSAPELAADSDRPPSGH